MKDKNITNMITSIISAVITMIFIPLIIIRYIGISMLGVIFFSVGYSILLAYFILKSIYYGIYNLKVREVLRRIISVFIDVFFLLILCYFCLSLDSYLKWIIFGVMCCLSLFNIFSSIFSCFNTVSYILHLMLILLFIYLILGSKSSVEVLMGISSVLIFFIGNIVGRITNNKLFLSSDIISVILFGLFLLFI